MAISFIILLTFVSNIVNLSPIIKIDSSTPFYITTNEVLFEFDYKSKEKTDIVCILKPYLNEIIFGKMMLSTNLTTFENLDLTNETEIVYMKTFLYDGLNYIILNSSDPFNEGEGKYYIYLIGNLACSFEIFLINEIKNLKINDSYFFSNIKIFENLSQNYFPLKVQNLEENIYMNMLLYNRTCSSIEITKNKEKIKCNLEIPNYLLLEKGNEYLIKFNLDVFNYFAINFINFKSGFIQSLDDESKSIIALSNSIFNYSIKIKDYKVNDYFGFVIDYPIKFLVEGDYLENENFDGFETNIKEIGYNFFITQKNDTQSNYFIFKIKFLDDYINKITIRKIDEIIFIEKFPFTYNIQKEKIYLFVFSQELLSFFKNYNSYVKLLFEHDNSMNIILNNYNKVFKDKIFVSKLDEINAVSFINLDKDGLFEINMLSENYNDLINSYYLIGESDKTSLYTSNIGEKIEMIPSGNRKVLFCNLVVGNTDFYEVLEVSDLFEKKNENISNYYEGLRELNNHTLILKTIINSYSMYEIFYQNYEKKNYFIGTQSKILYFSKYIKYNIFSLYDNMTVGIKLLNPNSELTLISNQEKKILNSKNTFIEMENLDEIEN